MKRILVVDDDPDVLHLLKRVLEAHQFVVETATNGLEAIERVRASAPDGIFLDLRMPVMGGFEALEAIRREDTAVPIILISASRSGNVAEEARAHGANGYLAKPFDPRELRAVLDTAFGPRP